MTTNSQNLIKRESHKQKEQMRDKHVSARIQKHSVSTLGTKGAIVFTLSGAPSGDKRRESHTNII